MREYVDWWNSERPALGCMWFFVMVCELSIWLVYVQWNREWNGRDKEKAWRAGLKEGSNGHDAVSDQEEGAAKQDDDVG